MSDREVVPVVPEDETVREWGRFYETLREKLFNGTEEVLSSMADFQKELVKHLGEMTELNGQISRRNADLAMKLSDFERDICHIRDYYDRIIASTKTVVDYGSDQRLVPHIRELIEEKRYAEAKQEINSFLRYLNKLIKRVEHDIDVMREDCHPDLETVRGKVRDQIKDCDVLVDRTKAKQHELQVSHGTVFRLGTSTVVYMMAGAASGLVLAACMPQEASQVTQFVTSAGSEVLSFCTGSVVTGLRSVMENAQLSDELKKRAESNINEVCRCLTGFFNQLNHYQSDIRTIKKIMDELKLDMTSLQQEVYSEDVDSNIVDKWVYLDMILQQMFESFTRLSTRVLEKNDKGFKKEEFDAIMEKLNRSVELTTLGTPV